MIPVVRGIILVCLVFMQTPYALCSEKVSFCAVGDILLARDVKKIIEEKGVDYPFEHIANTIRSHDLAFCNLECPLSKTGVPINKKFVFRGDPAYVEGLKKAGFNIVSIANNHSIDWGRDAFLETRRLLQSNGIYPIGGGSNQTESRSPIIVRTKGLSFAFFGYLDMLLEGIPYLEDKPAPAYAQLDEIVHEIRKAKDQVDFVIVSFHWGIENQSFPTINQTNSAHRIIDAGADIVLGHHPHVLQNLEIYKGKLIVYSLGNFVFDNRAANQRQSIIFGCEFEKDKIVKPYVIPIIINNLQPQIAEGQEADDIYATLKSRSKTLNVELARERHKFYMIDSVKKRTLAELPVGSYDVKNKKVVVYKSRVELLKHSGEIIDTLRLEGNSRSIKGSDLIVDGDMARLYVIFNAMQEKEGGRLGVIPIYLKKNNIGMPFVDSHSDFNPWKVMKCDVDGDGHYEVCAGVWKKTRYDDKYDNRLFVFNRSGNNIYPKWLGSKLSLPFLDFTFQNLDGNKPGQLIVLELHSNGVKRIMSYKWNGFGFAAGKVIEGISYRSNLDTF